VTGDRTLLWRMVGNLVENAIRYNRPGGAVAVTAATEGGEAVVRIENSGPLIDPTVVAELFEPFRRGARDRRGQPSGHGLGLAIVRSVAAVHGGSVTASARTKADSPLSRASRARANASRRNRRWGPS